MEENDGVAPAQQQKRGSDNGLLTFPQTLYVCFRFQVVTDKPGALDGRVKTAKMRPRHERRKSFAGRRWKDRLSLLS